MKSLDLSRVCQRIEVTLRRTSDADCCGAAYGSLEH